MKFLSAKLLVAISMILFSNSLIAADSASAGASVAKPDFIDPNRDGYFKVALGPAFPIGLKTDQMMYNLYGGYHHNLGARFAGKAFADLSIGAASNSARIANFGAGLEYYLQNPAATYGTPYVTADAGYGFVRNADDGTKDGVLAGVGAGYKFAIARMDLDVSAHYEVLTETLDGETPSLMGVRLGAAF